MPAHFTNFLPKRHKIAKGIGLGCRVAQKGGRVQRDIKENSELLADELADRNEILRYEYKREAKRRKVEEQNRLYDLLRSTTQTQIDRIAELTKEYRRISSTDPDSAKTLPFGVFCLFALALGVGMLLAAAMVFFRDTQFLWGVVSMLWMYATPIFYPESIIPARFMLVYKLNPLYHIIRFIRTILINGVSPEPKAYALALIASVVPLIIGSMVFKRTQDRFVLNI